MKRSVALASIALVLATPCFGATKAKHPAAAEKPAATKPTATKPAATKPTAASSDSGTVLKGGQEGTAFKSLTVEGEDKIQVEFERPPLALDLDPAKAPGLDWGTARDVLDRTVPDLTSPLLALSAQEHSPYLGRPWLHRFQTGPVATFHPDLKDVERWTLLIADSRGKTVASFGGKGAPPHDIVWDGRAKDGTSVIPGLTYSYVLEAFDRAGNKRNFVGEGFEVPAYRLETPSGSVLAFTGRLLAESGARPARETRSDPALLIEAASWINQDESVTRPVRVTVVARSAEAARGLADVV